MSLVSGAMVYIVIWWIALFTVLPIGVNPPDNPEKGFATSAPETPNLKKKFLLTTLISALVWIAIEIVMVNHWIRFV